MPSIQLSLVLVMLTILVCFPCLIMSFIPTFTSSISLFFAAASFWLLLWDTPGSIPSCERYSISVIWAFHLNTSILLYHHLLYIVVKTAAMTTGEFHSYNSLFSNTADHVHPSFLVYGYLLHFGSTCTLYVFSITTNITENVYSFSLWYKSTMNLFVDIDGIYICFASY